MQSLILLAVSLLAAVASHAVDTGGAPVGSGHGATKPAHQYVLGIDIGASMTRVAVAAATVPPTDDGPPPVTVLDALPSLVAWEWSNMGRMVAGYPAAQLAAKRLESAAAVNVGTLLSGR